MGLVTANDPSVRFGELLRDHRRAAGLTQEELAERAGLSPRSISGLESNDAHTPRRDTVALLVRALGLVGSERAAFEALVQRRRGPRPSFIPDQLPSQQAPLSGERVSKGTKHNLPRA